MRRFRPTVLVAIGACLLGSGTARPAAAADVTVTVAGPPKAISPDLFGVFFEDLNYAADGGLYPELVQNRSFEYTAADHAGWDALTAWHLVQRGGGTGTVTVDTADELNANNAHHAVLTVDRPGDGVGLLNDGFDGVAVKAGEAYDASLFARRLGGAPGPLRVRIESKAGVALAEADLGPAGDHWAKQSAILRPTVTDRDARLVVLASAAGSVALDFVSLYPRHTFHDRPNGLRADLAQTIADLHPKFMRFPGGCLVHGDGLDNLYKWKDTIGPIEQRRGQKNIWRYHQGEGLGYFEYFQFCQDLGAKPLPVVAAGVCCENSNYLVTHKWGMGQLGLPMDQMPAYIQDVLDLVEYANGPATSTWGAKRAAAGHPEPFGLQYLGIGNEDQITPAFRERFRMIYAAVRAAHPEITIIGTVGPSPAGIHYDAGWQLANELHVPMVDEHTYMLPDWFWANRGRYDAYDRSASAVYVGEFAAHEKDRKSTLRSALAEAAYMTGLERNGDVVRLASYAPLLIKQGHVQYSPALIWFDNTTISPTVNYYVQQAFARNAGDAYLPTAITGGDPTTLAASCVRDGNDLILKLVSRADSPVHARLNLTAVGVADGAVAHCTVIAGEATAQNAFGRPAAVLPVTSDFPVAGEAAYDVPPQSLTVIRIATRRVEQP